MHANRVAKILSQNAMQQIDLFFTSEVMSTHVPPREFFQKKLTVAVLWGKNPKSVENGHFLRANVCAKCKVGTNVKNMLWGMDKKACSGVWGMGSA